WNHIIGKRLAPARIGRKRVGIVDGLRHLAEVTSKHPRRRRISAGGEGAELAQSFIVAKEPDLGIFSINGGGQIGFHEEPRSMVSARCLIKSAREGICLAPLTRSRMY